MKFIAVLLIGCLLFLSSFPGMANAAKSTAKMDCCKKTGNDVCHHKSPKNEAGGCEKQGCAMLFSCSICGFIPVANLRLPSNIPFMLQQSITHYNTGNLSDYHKADWKPPKTC